MNKLINHYLPKLGIAMILGLTGTICVAKNFYFGAAIGTGISDNRINLQERSIKLIVGKMDSSFFNTKGDFNGKRALANIEIGYRFEHNVRAEIAYTYYGSISDKNESYGDENALVRPHVTDSLKAKGDVVMLNVYRDFDIDRRFIPYVMAGIGFAHNRLKSQLIQDYPNEAPQLPVSQKFDGENNMAFAWQVGAGTSYVLNKHFLLDAGLKYIYRGKVSTDENNQQDKIQATTSVKLASVDAIIGIRYLF